MDVPEPDAFGPGFFLENLGGLVRDRCPTSEDRLPVVLVHLSDGEVLDVCHVLGLARRWVALAVRDERDASGAARMRTAVLPYASIARFTFRSEAGDGGRIGFRQDVSPRTYAEGAARALSKPAGAGSRPRSGAS